MTFWTVHIWQLYRITICYKSPLWTAACMLEDDSGSVKKPVG